MDFVFNEEQEELRATAKSLLADHSGSEQIRQAMASDLGYDAQLWKRIGAELGWTALLVPEEHGGLGLGFVELAALLEVMGESLLCAPFFSSICLGANAILVAGSEAQKGEYLPAIAEGESRATLAFTGAAGHAGPEGVELQLRRDGDDRILDGITSFVLDGHSADLLVVAARDEGSRGEEGISLFAISAGTPGLERRALSTMDQTRRLARIEFRGVQVPVASRLGEDGAGGPLLSRILDRAAIALSAEQVGGAQRCLDLSVAYARERVQFGRPIGSFQAIKHKCADMMVWVESARSACYYAACVAAQGSDELASVAPLAKAYCSDAYFHCAAESIQIHGGVGFTWEYDVHLYFKRARSSESFLGDPSYHREKLAQRIGL